MDRRLSQTGDLSHGDDAVRVIYSVRCSWRLSSGRRWDESVKRLRRSYPIRPRKRQKQVREIRFSLGFLTMVGFDRSVELQHGRLSLTLLVIPH